MERYRSKVELTKLWLSVGLTIFGCIMLMFGFWASPVGVIDNSVLVAFGECLTFSGTIMGIAHLYSVKHKELEQKVNKKLLEIEKEKGGN